MTGFLIKDFIIVKKRILKLPVMISLFGAFLVAVFVNKDIAELFVFSSSALAIVALETLFQLDNQSHWKDFLVPYHLNPFKIVGSRYVFYAIACFATSFLAFVMSLIIEIIVPKTSPMQLFGITAIIFVVCSVFGIILLLAMYAFSQSGLMFIFIIILLLMAILPRIRSAKLQAFLMSQNKASLFLVAVAAVACLYVISYFFSVLIYRYR